MIHSLMSELTPYSILAEKSASARDLCARIAALDIDETEKWALAQDAATLQEGEFCLGYASGRILQPVDERLREPIQKAADQLRREAL
jgi:hypothetical protein